MSSFSRSFAKSDIGILKSDRMFNERLIPDIKTGNVFPAIRDGYLSFYYKKMGLFRYEIKSGFMTHKKYGITMKGFSDIRDYIAESDLHDMKIETDFYSGYQNLKANASRYPGSEDKVVSSILNKWSYAKEGDSSNVVVLDIEIAFRRDENASGSRGGLDKIDLLLFNLSTGELLFVEVKRFQDSRIWPGRKTNGQIPEAEIREQINRYNLQIERNYDDILKAYTNYAGIVNGESGFFNLDLPAPKCIISYTALLVTDFDRDQKRGRLRENLNSPSGLMGLSVSCKGNYQSIDLEGIWQELTTQ